MDANDLARCNKRRARERAEAKERPTRVYFRKWSCEPGETGEVIALFPDMDEGRATIGSYQHIGQHGPADSSLIRDLQPATPDEYAALKAELEGRGYVLQVEA